MGERAVTSPLAPKRLKRRKRNFYLRHCKRLERLQRKLERERAAYAWEIAPGKWAVPIDFRGTDFSYTYRWMMQRIMDDDVARGRVFLPKPAVGAWMTGVNAEAHR